jgi:hypothetical protein
MRKMKREVDLTISKRNLIAIKIERCDWRYNPPRGRRYYIRGASGHANVAPVVATHVIAVI